MDLSIIIPLYNCEKHLDRTLHVLEIQQVFDASVMTAEVILIDDGSRDATLSIARMYETKYPNIRLISKKNEGQHIARNIGLDIAKGKYIYLMDDDDVLTPGCLKGYLDIALSNKPDVLVFGWRPAQVDDIETILKKRPSSEKVTVSFIGTGEEFIRLSKGMISQDTVWNKLFRRDTLNQSNYRFANNVIFGEDTAFVWSIFTHSTNIMSVDSIGYYWISHPTNCTNTMSTDKAHGLKWKSSQEYIAHFLQQLIEKNPDFSESLRHFISIKRDSFTVAYWAYYISSGWNWDNICASINRQKEWHIYPITSQFPPEYYPSGISRVKFRLLWNIIANETLLKLAFRLRNFQLRLFSKR